MKPLSRYFSRQLGKKNFINFNPMSRLNSLFQIHFKVTPLLVGIKSKVQKVELDYDKEVEDAINIQIMVEMKASHTYLAMASYFGRAGIALPGIQKFFEEQSNEERNHAIMFMQYLNERGGRVRVMSLSDPNFIEYSPIEAFQKTLAMEKEVYKTLLHLHQVAGERHDPNLSDFLETNFIEGQVKDIKKIADYVATLERVGDEGLGVYLFDQELARVAAGGGGGGGAGGAPVL